MIGLLIFGLAVTCAQSYQTELQPKAPPSPFGYQVAVNFGSHGNRRQGAHVVTAPQYTAPQPQPTWNAQPQPTWKAQPEPAWKAQPQPAWKPQPTWKAQPQPTWNAQPTQYTPQNSANLHQKRLNDPNWIVNNPIQPWEAAYNGPEPLPKQTYSQSKQTYSKPQVTYQHHGQQPTQQSGTSYSARNHAVHMQRLNDPLWAVKGGNNAPSATFGYQYTSGGHQPQASWQQPQSSWQQNSIANYRPGAHVPTSHTARHNDPLWAVKEQGGHYRFRRSTPQQNVHWAVPNPDTAGINNVHWAAPNPTTAGINNVNWAAPNPETAGINNVHWAAPAGNNNPLWALG